MVWIKSNRAKVWNGTPKGDNLGIVSRTLTKKKSASGITEDLGDLWDKTYSVEAEKWNLLHPFETTTPPVHLAENLINFIRNGVNFQENPQAEPNSIALIIAPNDANIIHASWLCGVRTVLLSPNQFVNEAMKLLVNSMPQLYHNFLQIKPGRFFVRYPWFQFERKWTKNEPLFKEIVDIVDWSGYRSAPFKVPKKPKEKKDEVEEGSQAFSQMNKGIQKTVVMKKRTRSEGNVEDESPKKKVKKKHRRRH